MLPLAILMSRSLKAIPHDAPLRQAARFMRDHGIGSLLVRKGEDFVGIVSETDLVRRAMAEGLDPERIPVEQVMSHPIISLDIDKTAEDANAIMSERGIRHLAITDQSKIVGILSVRDLLIYFKNQF